MPYKFPFFIGGEVNFYPRSIDFDLSRTNIIESQKSRDFRKDISISLKHLFRQALDDNNKTMVDMVKGYLAFYLVNVETNAANFQDSYQDFYTKKELISLLMEHLDFEILPGYHRKLGVILQNLKNNGINKIYIIPRQTMSDIESIIVSYLRARGNFVVTQQQFSPLFRDGQQPVQILQVMHIIAQTSGLQLKDVASVTEMELNSMCLNKNSLDQKLIAVISAIQIEHNVVVEFAELNSTSKSYAQLRNTYYVNYKNETFQSLLENLDKMSVATIQIYLAGILGIKLKTFDIT